MSGYRLLGDAFSAYFFDRVLFDDAKLAPAFRSDTELLREARRLVREARKTLAHRATAQSTESQLLRPLAALAGWSVGNESELVETVHGSEDGGYPIVAADGTTWARAFCAAPDEDLDATLRGRHRRFALSSAIARVLEATTTPYAFALNRNEVRLVRRADGGTISAIAFDLDALAEWSNDSERAWRLVFGLTTPSALEPPLLLERLVERGRREMVGVGDRLGRQVLEAVDGFARSLYTDEGNRARLPAAGEENDLAILYGELLRVLYRCLFALFAEARGLVPIDLPLYRDNYAISTAYMAPKAGAAARLRALFMLLRRGADLGGGERIPAFGGALFATDAAPLVESLEWNDDAITALIAKLTRVDTARGQVPVSYRELDEERLGAIYERLLELRLSVADRTLERIRVQGRELVVDPASLEELSGYERAPGATLDDLPNSLEASRGFESSESEVFSASPAARSDDNEADTADEDLILNGESDDEDAYGPAIEAESVEGLTAESNVTAPRASARAKRQVTLVETISAGTPYLANSSGRKETASYYTARDLVDFLVRETIDPQAEHAEPAVILHLRVLDPAMGSGHFLIGAMRRLADHLLAAYRRTEERDGFETLPPHIQAAWENDRELLTVCRQLVAVHCLYGVDKNPLAVDLARVALWLATAAADHPLSFLDHRLRRGDSLLGLDVHQIIAVGSAAKTKRKRGPPAKGQYSMLTVGEALVDEIALEHAVQNGLVRAFAVIRGFLAIVDDEREPFELKRQRADAVRSVFEPLATLHAARVGRLLGSDEDEGSAAYVAALRTFATFNYLTNRDREAIDVFVRRGGDEGAFCWPLEFPDAYYAARDDGEVILRSDAGFDVVLGNPPWDKILLDKKDFYSRFDPLIADFQGSNADDRMKVIDSRNTQSAPMYRHEMAKVSSYALALTRSGNYAFQIATVEGKRTGGHPDTYKYFLERDFRLLAARGIGGVVLPGALTSADGATGLRRLLLDHANVRSMFVFENRRKLFPIDSRFKFQTLVFDHEGPTKTFEAAFWLHDVSILKRSRSQRADESLSLHVSDLKLSSPERLAILEVRGARDLEIIRRMRAAGETVASYIARNGGRVGQEFNMTTDRKLFFTREQLTTQGAIRIEDVFHDAAGARFIPLHEGRMIQAFDSNAKLYVSGNGRSAVWSENRHPKRAIEPHFWVREDSLDASWTGGKHKLYWCDVTGSTNERTSMAALVPNNAVSGHSLAAMYLQQDDSYSLLLAVAVFNSLVFDWYMRLSVAQHMSFNYVGPAPFIPSVVMKAFQAAVNLVGSGDLDYPERADCRADLDAAVAIAYGLSFTEFVHVVSAFPLLDRAEPLLKDEARSTITRDLALAAYCRLSGQHDPEHADRVRAARAEGALGYVATPLRAQLPKAYRRSVLEKVGRK